MSQAQRGATQQILEKAKNIHRTVKINSYQLQNKLNFIQEQIENHSSFLTCSLCSSSKSNIDQGFKRAFKKLSLTQKVMLYYRICINIKKMKQSQKDSVSLQKGDREMMDTTVYIKDKHQYINWTVTRITISIKTKKINITDKSILLDMHDYLLRSIKQKSKQKCFALQSTLSNERFKTIKFSNEGTDFDELYKFFKKVHKQTIKDEVRTIFLPSTQKQHVQFRLTKVSSNQQTTYNQSPLIPITDRIYRLSTPIQERMMTLKLISASYASSSLKLVQKQMLERERVIRIKDQSYNEIYIALLPENLLEGIQKFDNFKKINENQFYSVYFNEKQSKLKKIFKFKCSEIVIFEWIVNQLNNFSNFHKWKPYMQSIKCLKAFPSQKTKLFHETYLYQKQKINFIYIRHHFDLPNKDSIKSYNKKIYYFYDQSIEQLLAKNYFKINQPIANISYIIWKFSEINQFFQLTIQAKMTNFNQQSSIKFIDNFLGEFQKVQDRKLMNENELQNSQIHLNTILFQNQYLQQIHQIQQIDNDTQYYTITDQLPNDIKQKKTLNKINSKQQLKLTNDTFICKNKQIKSSNEYNYIVANKENYLKFKHPKYPYKKEQSIFKQPKTGVHPSWETEWKITPKGELININKQKIQAQNSVLKGVFKNFGRNFMSGKSMLSLSLPVDVFGDDSNLSRLCYSYGYAPILLEAAVENTDSIQRFKNVFGFAVSAMVCYLRMDKPFNPILGETCQALIDGCPIYGEQISHHPPISAVFMKGRGYTVFGNLQAKVELSFNSASGINSGEICVSFDPEDLSKKKIRYTGPPGELSGVLYGDRKMCMIKTSYFVDEENYLFCELNWGKHKGKSEFSKNFSDSVEGTVYKLKQKVDIKKIKSIKKDDIQKQIGLINGRWTGALYYNTDLIVDTFQTFPHVVMEYKSRLQSDVEFRKDLQLRRTEPNLQKAQAAKQELEQLQRNDRKLREQYNQDSKH